MNFWDAGGRRRFDNATLAQPEVLPQAFADRRLSDFILGLSDVILWEIRQGAGGMKKSLLGLLFILAISLALSLSPTARPAEAADPVVFDFDPSISWGRECTFPGLEMSPDARILMVMMEGGDNPGSGIQIDYEFGVGHQYEADLANIAVDWPGQPVILILNAQMPAIWQVAFTLNTRIEGVLVSGQGRQIVVGLPPEAPLLNSSDDNKGVCGYCFPLAFGRSDWRMGQISQKLFGREPDQFFKTKAGYALVSRTADPPGQLFAQEQFDPARYRYPGSVPARGAGLRQALDQGLIRPATDADRRKWMEARARNAGVNPDLVRTHTFQFSGKDPLCNADYVILSEKFIFPAGFTHVSISPVFYLPQGMALPQGNPDDSLVLFLEDGRCLGPNCAGRLMVKTAPSP
jgi:hypothetical protein